MTAAQRTIAAVPLPDPAASSREGLGADRLESGGGDMRSYEAMVIVDAQLEEGDIQKAVDKFVAAVGEVGGESGHVDRWGNRRFAYEINHKNEGYYFVAPFTAPEEAIDRLKRLLQISDEYIRGKIVRLPEPAASSSSKEKTDGR
ncbi:MAG: 30S ribosomal protein S6 [Actinomycetota bacterium]